MKAIDFNSSPLIKQSLARAKAKNDSAQLLKLEATQSQTPNYKDEIGEILNLHGIPQDEMTPMVKAALDSLMDEVRLLRSERVRLMDSLRNAESLADTDSLSGVFNARAFLREMGRIMSFGQRYDIPSSLLFFDLNGFKGVNDSFGHAAGDLIIQNFAKTLKENIRESDIVGRVGGDEFAILLAKANEQEAEAKSAQLKSAIAAIRIPFNGRVLTTDATIGVYAIDNKDTPQSALSAADEAMYQGKINARIQIL